MVLFYVMFIFGNVEMMLVMVVVMVMVMARMMAIGFLGLLLRKAVL